MDRFPYHGPADLKDPVLQALTRVVDPELALSIVDIGLIYGVAFEEGTLRVDMTMTSPACPMSEVVVDDVQAELQGVLPIGCEVEVHLVWEPPWEPTRMSPRARQFMGW